MKHIRSKNTTNFRKLVLKFFVTSFITLTKQAFTINTYIFLDKKIFKNYLKTLRVTKLMFKLPEV